MVMVTVSKFPSNGVHMSPIAADMYGVSCVVALMLKVIDSADVIAQVLDARDPQGTRSKHIEEYLCKEKPHKQLIFVLNKADLIPTWATVITSSGH